MNRRAGAAIAVVTLVALVLLWLLRAPDTDEPPADLPIPDVAKAPPMPSSTEAPAEAPATWREIACLLPVEPTQRGRLHVLVEVPGGQPTWSSGHVVGPVLEFMAPTDDGVGLVTLPGFERAGLLWFTASDGEVECYFPKDPAPGPRGTVRVSIPPTAGHKVSIDACGNRIDGMDVSFLEAEVAPGECAIEICVFSEYRTFPCRVVGTVEVVADQVLDVPVDLPPLPEDFEFELTAETEGIHLRYQADGVTTERLIVGVEGIETATMTPGEFQELVDETGRVEIEVANADGTTRMQEFALPVQGGPP